MLHSKMLHSKMLHTKMLQAKNVECKNIACNNVVPTILQEKNLHENDRIRFILRKLMLLKLLHKNLADKIQTFLCFPQMESFPLQLNPIATVCKNVLLWRWNILDPLPCVLSKKLSLFCSGVFVVFLVFGHSPSAIRFFSNFTFLGCFCFWMVESLDFSPFKFTLSKLCKTYHLILQTSYTEKYSLHLWLWTVSPTCYKNTFPRYKNFSY